MRFLICCLKSFYHDYVAWKNMFLRDIFLHKTPDILHACIPLAHNHLSPGFHEEFYGNSFEWSKNCSKHIDRRIFFWISKCLLHRYVGKACIDIVELTTDRRMQQELWLYLFRPLIKRENFPGNMAQNFSGNITQILQKIRPGSELREVKFTSIKDIPIPTVNDHAICTNLLSLVSFFPSSCQLENTL